VSHPFEGHNQPFQERYQLSQSLQGESPGQIKANIEYSSSNSNRGSGCKQKKRPHDLRGRLLSRNSFHRR
jgi:hypothetical protein